MLINQTQKAILLIAFFVLIIDRLAKSLALSIWQFEAVPLSSWFKLSFATNPNISFSLPFSGPLLYLGLLVAILILIYLLPQFFTPSSNLAQSIYWFNYQRRAQQRL
jgi:lipoprotein signal peptidase